MREGWGWSRWGDEMDGKRRRTASGGKGCGRVGSPGLSQTAEIRPAAASGQGLCAVLGMFFLPCSSARASAGPAVFPRGFYHNALPVGLVHVTGFSFYQG